MHLAQPLLDQLNHDEQLNIKNVAEQFANRFFVSTLSNALLHQLFIDLKNTFEQYLQSSEKKIAKAHGLYYYLEKSIIENIELEKPNYLDLTMTTFSNGKDLSEDSKVQIMMGLKYGVPISEHESYHDYYVKKIEEANQRYALLAANPSTFCLSTEYESFDKLKSDIYLDIFSASIYFKSDASNKEREAKIDEFLNIFKEKDFLAHAIMSNDKQAFSTKKKKL